MQGQQQGLFNRLVWHPRNAWLCGIGGGNNGFILFHDTATRTTIHQANLPMHVHDAVFNEDFTTLYAVGHQKISVQELPLKGLPAPETVAQDAATASLRSTSARLRACSHPQ